MEIRDVNLENIDDLVNLCIPPDKKDDPLFVEGMNAKRKWATQVIEKYGSTAKLAYLNSKPVGLIQYQPNPEERLVKITCIFVPEEKNFRKGIGKSLLEALIEDMKEPKPAFNNDVPLAFVTWAFQVPGRYPQHKFYQRMKFQKVKENDPFLLYYPLKKGYIYRPKEKKFIPQEEDRGEALIFYDPSCPWSIYFSEKIKESIGEVAPNVPIRMINKFEESEEVEKRGQVPSCAVNRKPIETFFMDKENFQKEVRKALGHSR
ncbi:MAG: GNAT family N-acetyltransferase [Candidatus Bathyarchaeia archaeon]